MNTTNWINVKDKLPELICVLEVSQEMKNKGLKDIYSSYLVLTTDGLFIMISSFSYNKKGEIIWNEWKKESKNVTHWMELPCKPNKETTNEISNK